uniref:Uncharacterized protein n=1 Tax=Mimivirus LCMiAC02 TaxID=2506609 RepID=A0A4D5XFB0_9VIRU|nr:MAG: uncharacterized protein LCMiAC02_04380 [Mimivirus LCMiAC02]
MSNVQIKNSSIIGTLYNTIKSTDKKYNYVSTKSPRIIYKTNKLQTPYIYQLLKKLQKIKIPELYKNTGEYSLIDKLIPPHHGKFLKYEDMKLYLKKNDFENFYKWYSRYITIISVERMCIDYKIIENVDIDDIDSKSVEDICEIVGMIKTNTLYNLLYNNDFISLDIQMFAETNDLVFTQYNYNNIKISTYISTNDKNVYNIDHIIHICNFMRILANKPSQKINIEILYTDIKKKFRGTYKGELYLGPGNVNSGATWKESIKIWRFEEIEKVLIHELIHYLDLDGIDDKKLEKYYRDTFNIKGKINPNESYTETLAMIIYTTYSTYILRKNKKLNGTMIDDYNEVLKYEINFSLFQMAKILHYFKIESFPALFDKTSIESNSYIVQKSSIVSYYLVKIALLFSYNDFINYITDGIKLYEITDNEEKRQIKTDNYTLLVMKALKNKTFEKCVMYYMNKLHHIKDEDRNKFIWNTLRMSCIQFQL